MNDEEHEAATDDDRDEVAPEDFEDEDEEEDEVDDPRWHQPLITRILADAPPPTLFSVDALARTLASPVSAIEGAIERGELPPPIRIGERRLWTVGAVNRHIRDRLKEAAAEQKRRGARGRRS